MRFGLRARVLRVLLLPFASHLPSSCSSTETTTPSARPIEVLLTSPPVTLDPRYATDGAGVRVTRLVHAGLIQLDPDTLRPIGAAAETWRWISPLKLELTLRQGVRFHTGATLSSSDVCATLQAVGDPALESPQRSVIADLATCEARDTRTLVLTLARPHATLLTDLELPILRADEARRPQVVSGEIDGLGPFRVLHADGGRIDLVPSGNFSVGHAEMPVTLRVVRDENARALRLLAGRADVAPNCISPILLPALERASTGLLVHARPGANVTYLLMQTELSPLDHADIRRAMGRALHRRLIVETLLDNRATVAEGFLPPMSFAHARARPSAEGAGEGQVDLPSTAPARPLTLLTSTDRMRKTIARAVAQDLNDAGFRVDVVPLDLGVMLQRLSRGDFDLAMLQMPEITEPNLLRWFFHSDSIPSAEHPSSGANRMRYRSHEVDGWLDRAAAAGSDEERTQLYGRVEQRLAEDMPAVPLWHEDQIAVVSKRARDFQLSAEGRWLSLARLRPVSQER